jgi:hypothetical protein
VLEVRGPNVFSGYWRQPEKTAEDLRPDGFFVTGDLVEIDDDGYVHIVGRAKDLIISGGLNVYPKEVEDLIDALPGVAESAVFGVPHPDFGEAVVAAVVPRADGAVDGPAVLAGLDGQLARFKQPKAVFVVDELPRNAMAKVQKAALREVRGRSRSRSARRRAGRPVSRAGLAGGGGPVRDGSATAGATSCGAGPPARRRLGGLGDDDLLAGCEVPDGLLVGARRAALPWRDERFGTRARSRPRTGGDAGSGARWARSSSPGPSASWRP